MISRTMTKNFGPARCLAVIAGLFVLPGCADYHLTVPDSDPFTPQGQEKMLADVMAVVRHVPDGRGLGVFYWEATWTAVTGNGWDPAEPLTGNNWENQALFDYEDKPLPAMRLFNLP